MATWTDSPKSAHGGVGPLMVAETIRTKTQKEIQLEGSGIKLDRRGIIPRHARCIQFRRFFKQIHPLSQPVPHPPDSLFGTN